MPPSAWTSLDHMIRSWAHELNDLVGWPFRWFLKTPPGKFIRRHTHPNFWSALRLPMGVLVGLCLAVNFRTAAIVVYILAVLTDRFDGEFARMDKKITREGELLDGAADSLLQSALLLGLAHAYPRLWTGWTIGRLPYVLVALEVVRVTGGLLLGHLPTFAHLHRARQPNMSGKFKMVAMSVSVVLIMVHRVRWAQNFAALAVGLSVYSLGRHIYDARHEQPLRIVPLQRGQINQ